MKSLTHAIIGVTSGVAAFVVLDLARHHGVELPRIYWDQPLRASIAAPDQAHALVQETLEAAGTLTALAFAPTAEAVVATDDRSVEPDDQSRDASAELVVDPTLATLATPTSRAATGDLDGPSGAITRAGSATPNAPASAESDLARAGERAKALAAAMERLGKRLDGTSHRGFPR